MARQAAGKAETAETPRKTRGPMLRVAVEVSEGQAVVSCGEFKATMAVGAAESGNLISFAVQSALRATRPGSEADMVAILEKLAKGTFGKRGSAVSDSGPDMLTRAWARVKGVSVEEAAKALDGLSRSDKQKLHHHPKIVRAKIAIEDEEGMGQEDL